MSFSNLPMGEAPPSLPSLPLSESQLSVDGSSYGNAPRSGGSSLGLPPTRTSSVASSFYQGPPHSAPAHFGGRGMPRIVKRARSTNCYECEEPFNLFVRRHHCRMCGNSFWHEHSKRPSVAITAEMVAGKKLSPAEKYLVAQYIRNKKKEAPKLWKGEVRDHVHECLDFAKSTTSVVWGQSS
ncbi:hypothetical protein PI124_g17755 [Phytophthora idaei]|nr:hypothetical protein PI124_g17755 [Phytophthora idaei]